MAPYNFESTESLLVCSTCGTQFSTSDRTTLKTCRICDDPRQYNPPSGPSFTTLADIRARHENVFTTHPSDHRLTTIVTQPPFAIGQRAFLIATPAGNILWDCITLLDRATVSRIQDRGGLAAIVISHPHFYSAHVEWARAFACPVYLAAEDSGWLARTDADHQRFLEQVETPIPGRDGAGTEALAVKLGGHFPGSLVLLFDGRLLVADTLMTTPAGSGSREVDALGEKRGAGERPVGLNSFAFMWSIPNYIPLGAEEVARMWGVLKRYQFRSTHGGFARHDIESPDVKARVLRSMQVQIKAMGWENHPLLLEEIEQYRGH